MRRCVVQIKTLYELGLGGWELLGKHTGPPTWALRRGRCSRWPLWALPLPLVRVLARAPITHEQEDRSDHPDERDKQWEELEQQHRSIVRPCSSGHALTAPSGDRLVVETELSQYLVGVLA